MICTTIWAYVYNRIISFVSDCRVCRQLPASLPHVWRRSRYVPAGEHCPPLFLTVHHHPWNSLPRCEYVLVTRNTRGDMYETGNNNYGFAAYTRKAITALLPNTAYSNFRCMFCYSTWNCFPGMTRRIREIFLKLLTYFSSFYRKWQE
jgi:hypothetical protein